MTNEQKAQRLDEIAACPLCMESGDGKLLREAAAMMRERGGISWTSECRCHGMVLTSAVYRNRLIAIVGRSGRTFFWTVSKVAAREHEEFGTADTLEAARSAAVAWVDQQEGRDV